MARICPRCGNPNDDTVKFCTACGTALDGGMSEAPSVPSFSSPQSSGSSSSIRILAGVLLLVVIIIIAAIFTVRIPGSAQSPFATPATTPAATPVITETIAADTPSPVQTTLPTETPSTATAIPTIPSPTKTIVCPSDRHLCSGACADVMNDPANCGGCDIACNAGMACQMGHCLAACEPGQATCYDGCHNLSYDSLNCGVCGNTCPVGLMCNQSVCSPPVKTAIPTYSG